MITTTTMMIIMCSSTYNELARKFAIFVNVSKVDALTFQCEEEKKEGCETERQRESIIVGIYGLSISRLNVDFRNYIRQL